MKSRIMKTLRVIISALCVYIQVYSIIEVLRGAKFAKAVPGERKIGCGSRKVEDGADGRTGEPGFVYVDGTDERTMCGRKKVQTLIWTSGNTITTGRASKLEGRVNYL
jgi:hypothetical protein